METSAETSRGVNSLNPKQDGADNDLAEEVKELLDDCYYSMFLMSINDGDKTSAKTRKADLLFDGEEDDDEDYKVPKGDKEDDEVSSSYSSSSESDSSFDGAEGEADFNDDHEDAIDPDEAEEIRSPGSSLRIPRASLRMAELMYPPFWRMAFALKNIQSGGYDSDNDPDYRPSEDEDEDSQYEELSSGEDCSPSDEEGQHHVSGSEDCDDYESDSDYFEDGELEMLKSEKDSDLSLLASDLSKMLEDLVIDLGEGDCSGYDDDPSCTTSESENEDHAHNAGDQGHEGQKVLEGHEGQTSISPAKAKNTYETFLARCLSSEAYCSSSDEDPDFEPPKESVSDQEDFSTGPSDSSSSDGEDDGGDDARHIQPC